MTVIPREGTVGSVRPQLTPLAPPEHLLNGGKSVGMSSLLPLCSSLLRPAKNPKRHTEPPLNSTCQQQKLSKDIKLTFFVFAGSCRDFASHRPNDACKWRETGFYQRIFAFFRNFTISGPENSLKKSS